jgi:hypothetical protein
MSKITNQPTITDDEMTTRLRNAIEHRASWMYNLLKEAKKHGLSWDDIGRKAVFETGEMHGGRIESEIGKDASVEEFAKKFAVGPDRKIFEMEVLKEDENGYYLDFHYCPLVSAWQKLGATEEEIEELCDIAMDGDRGIASKFENFGFSLGHTIAQGARSCQIRFDTRKKATK